MATSDDLSAVFSRDTVQIIDEPCTVDHTFAFNKRGPNLWRPPRYSNGHSILAGFVYPVPVLCSAHTRALGPSLEFAKMCRCSSAPDIEVPAKTANEHILYEAPKDSTVSMIPCAGKL